MSDQFLGEIRISAVDLVPKGWAACNGQLLPINQNQALFSLIGTTFGGDGRTTFALPDYRGRVPMHAAQLHPLGERGGEVAHTVTVSELPAHTHQLQGTAAWGTRVDPSGNLLAAERMKAYHGTERALLAALPAATVGTVGGTQPHENRQPFLVLNFCIALVGVFPSPS